MASILDLIYSIASEDSQETEANFQSIMAERLTNAIQAKREALAQSLFSNQEEAVVTSEELALFESEVKDDALALHKSHMDITGVPGFRADEHRSKHYRLADELRAKHGHKAMSHLEKYAHNIYQAKEDHASGNTEDAKHWGTVAAAHLKMAKRASDVHDKIRSLKEEVEQIDELSTGTLAAYSDAATKDMRARRKKMAKTTGAGGTAKPADVAKYRSRWKNRDRAEDKMNGN